MTERLIRTEEQEPGDGLYVLAAEDHPDLRELYKQVFGSVFSRYDVFGDGLEALSHFESNDVPYNVLITDLEMPPGMNGAELARNIREASGGKILTVLLSARVDERLSEDVTESFDLVFPKSFKLVEREAMVKAIKSKMAEKQPTSA